MTEEALIRVAGLLGRSQKTVHVMLIGRAQMDRALIERALTG